ncbi:DUF819 family protein [Leptospira sp. 201903070]|uniref:DUF819 family protein n=1 Tax=Leptospira ainlahdjerensis TaxID=2810033 RepID=A0ABS2UCX5_9LEPT|nr:DUF819 family protein [Leptospira ainlahdjerensis]MBM9577609.1 DUF819 family protein [Leptospira ainlahdjerensis]
MESIISTINSIALSLFILFFPWFALRIAKKIKFFGLLGPVSLCYVAGIFLGNIIPSGWISKSVPRIFAEIAIPLAIPLLLSSTDFRKGFGEAKLALFSFFLSVVSVAISSCVAGFYFSFLHPESAKIAGMLAGMYTGGAPNLNAVGLAVDTTKETIALVNTVDVVIGGIYLLFLLTVGKKFFSFFLKKENTIAHSFESAISEEENFSKHWKNLVFSNGVGLLLAMIGFGVSIAFTFLIFSSLYAPSILLGITTWGIGTSFHSKVRQLKTYEFGSYLILVFSVAVGFLANLEELKRDFGSVFLILICVLFGAILLHLILGILFRIPVDTWMITSVSSIYGPAFVPPVTQAIRNRDVLVVGILTGLIGYAIGNYLGIGIFSILSLIRR